MIVLYDLGADFWRNYYGTGSATEAYELTLGDVSHYRDSELAVCCDSRSKRHEWSDAYKASRSPKPQEAIDSIRSVEQQIVSWGVPVLRCDGYEADDVIASLATQAWLFDVRVVSSDKDLYQLICPNVELETRGRDGRKIVREQECVEKFGVRPDQMRDWLALAGDSADNIVGCPHCGPGRARDLLQRFGTLDAILAASDEEIQSVRGVGQKTLVSLREWDPSLAVRLVTLMVDAPVELEQVFERKTK